MPTQHYPALLGHVGVAFGVYILRLIGYLISAYIVWQLIALDFDLPKLMHILQPQTFFLLALAHTGFSIISGLLFAYFAKFSAVTIRDNTITGRSLSLREVSLPLDNITSLTPHKSFGVSYLLVASGAEEIAIYRQSERFAELEQTLQSALTKKAPASGA